MLLNVTVKFVIFFDKTSPIRLKLNYTTLFILIWSLFEGRLIHDHLFERTWLRWAHILRYFQSSSGHLPEPLSLIRSLVILTRGPIVFPRVIQSCNLAQSCMDSLLFVVTLIPSIVNRIQSLVGFRSLLNSSLL